MKNFIFHTPVKIVFGQGEIIKLNSMIKSFNNVLIITDSILYKKTDIIKKVVSSMNNQNISVFSEVEENPSYLTVEKGAEFARSKNVDLIIGVGGGSSMDAAKGIALRTKNNTSIKEIVEKRASVEDVLPIICIPTSSGTGSEVTPFAVFTDTESRVKNGYAHTKIFPFIALIDSELSHSMPKTVAINTGLDALAHAIEAYLSLESFELNDNLALDAIKIIINHLEDASQKKSESMDNMAYAAMLGGIAISHASTILPHIMGYPLTIHHGLPHGKACIILQPSFLNYMKENKLELKKIGILNELFKEKGGIKNYIESLGISTNLSYYGVKKEDLNKYAEQTIIKSDVKITPGNISVKTIEKIYESAF